jgi:hypothetical protein
MSKLDKLEALEKAATNRDWRIQPGIVEPSFDKSLWAESGNLLADLLRPKDAELIAEMRNALPALLAVARAAKQLIRGLELVQQLEGQVTEKAWEKELKLQQALTALEESE